MSPTLKGQTKLLRSLAHPTRLEILRLLSHRGLTVKELQSMIGRPQANVSQHLQLLRDEQVVFSRREGKRVLYALTHPDFVRAIGLLEHFVLGRMRKDKRQHSALPHTTRMHDPVCGMAVEPSIAAAALSHKGTTFFFCGRGCKSTFQKNPMKYV